MVLISSCVDDKLRQSMARTIERLGGRLTASAKDFTAFVTLGAARGRADRGFVKSLNSLSALASGERLLWPALSPLTAWQGWGLQQKNKNVQGWLPPRRTDLSKGQAFLGQTMRPGSLHHACALIPGAPIMSEKWVDGSGRSGAFLDPRDHLLQDDAAEAKLGFSLAHAWGAAQQSLLLQSTAVLLTPGVLCARATGPALSSGSPSNLGEMQVSGC